MTAIGNMKIKYNKIEENKAQYDLDTKIDRLLRFQLYCQEILVNKNF